MSRTSTPPRPGALEFPVTVVFRSDWGVGTGAGIAGGVNSVVEKDANGRPVVRGTVLAGVVREQANTAARALDEAPRGPWHDFTTALFGTPESPRLVSFTDATVPDADPDVAVHEVVSLSIDEATGTAKNDFLRFFERAAACTLRGRVSLAQTDLRGRPLTWDAAQREGAELILALSGLLVRGIGSNRSDGDGLCDVLIGDAADAHQAKARCRTRIEEWAGPAPTPPAAGPGFTAPVLGPAPAAAAMGGAGFVRAALELRLLTPVVSYEVPLSNEVRSLDFLRGTVLLPWVHRRLRRAFPDDAMVRDAVVAGDLFVSDATAVAQGVLGLPAPLVLTRPKTPTQGSAVLPMRNLLFGASPAAGDADGAQVPVRSGYVFPGLVPADAPTGTKPAGSLGAPALVGRQSTAHDPATGAASQGRLFLVRALPAGLRMGASVVVSQRLYEHLGERLHEAFPPGEPVAARLGSRRMSGSYGRVECRMRPFAPVAEAGRAWGPNGSATLWFTSDVLTRSGALGPGGTVPDLLGALGRGGAAVGLADPGPGLAAGVRHRRVDSWSAADQQPRATRVAVRAGSVLRVQPAPGADPDAVLAALARLSVTGCGELTAQGFGRFVLGHELLDQSAFPLCRLRQRSLVDGRERESVTAAGGDR